MFKLDHKLIIFSILASATISFAQIVKKPDIAGGVYYPIVGDQTHIYKVNPNAYGLKLYKGRVPTKNELKAWDKDVMPDGTGLPEGKGSVEKGEELYEAKCIMCHGDFGSGGGGYPALSAGNAYEVHETLKNNRWKDPEADGPIRVFGSYWPQASTLFWYIKDAMPHQKTKTLTNDETYALVAYILNINEIEIDGEEVDEEYVLTRDKFLKIQMPNKDGFVPNIDGKDGVENVRKFFSNPKNFGAIKVKESERCMTNCQKASAKVVRISGEGISDFHPPISVERSLPKEVNKEEKKSNFNPQKVFETNCAMCHNGEVAPGAKNKGAWAKFIKKGIEKVYENGIKGTNNGMPPKGGSSISDEEFKKVVDFMLDFD